MIDNGRSLRVGVLTNPRSGGNKKAGNGIREVLSCRPDVMHREAYTPDGVKGALSDFAQNGIELIVINGGDGTVQASLTSIGNENPFDTLPVLALLCSGTTSMLPRDIGIAGSPTSALQRILGWSQNTDARFGIKVRPVLRVLSESQDSPLFGMFFGAGAICQGIKIFHSKDNPKGRRGQLMPSITMLRLLLSILFKKYDKVTLVSSQATIDGQPIQQRKDIVFFISTLERLFLGMRPYWGVEDAPLHFTAVGAEPKYVLRVISSLFRSQKSRHAIPLNGYYSHNVNEVHLHMQGEFTLDGELYDAGTGEVTIAPAGPFLFLCPQ